MRGWKANLKLAILLTSLKVIVLDERLQEGKGI